MEIRGDGKFSTHRRAALAAGLLSLGVAITTVSGAMVFSPEASANLGDRITGFVPKTGVRIAETLNLGRFSGRVPTAQALNEDERPPAEPEEPTEAQKEKAAAWLGSLALLVAPEEIAGVKTEDIITQAREEGTIVETSTGTTAEGNDVDSGDPDEVVLTVTKGDVDQAVAAGEAAVGFWGTLWGKMVGLVEALVEVLVEA